MKNVALLAHRRAQYCTGMIVIFLAMVVGAAPASAIDTIAKHAYVMDAQTGAVLLEKDADVPMPPASMSKLMTIYMIFDGLKRGEIDLEDRLQVSEKAWRKGGSKMFVKVGSRVRVEDLLRGIIVQSGNDACIVIAEGLAGTEENFAEQMTRRAREIGLEQSTFRNATGWPDPEHMMSSRDIAHLSRRLIEEFPEYYPYFAEQRFTYNGIKQGNRNPLLYKSVGADGLKTGHTEASGYGLAASLKRGDRRIIVVVNGLDSVNTRSSESLRLADWAFRSFNNYSLFKKGEEVERADVWLGQQESVPLIIEDDIAFTMLRKSRRQMTVKVVYDNPIPAPIQQGTPLARLIITAPQFETIDVPLVAGETVDRLGMIPRIGAAVRFLLWGASG